MPIVRKRRSDGSVRITADTALIDAGDLLYYDASTNEVHPASNQSDQGSEPLNQELFAALFLGVSQDRSPSGTTDEIMVNVDPLAEYEFDCPSQTWDIGDLVGASENTSNDGLLDQTVEAVATLEEAIGGVVQQETTAVTTVRVRFFSRVVGSLALSSGAAGPSVATNVQTLSGNLVLTTNMPRYQILDPGGADRNVDLPAEAEGVSYVIYNAADADETLTIRADTAGATQATIDRAGSIEIVSDGTSWFVKASGPVGAPVNVSTMGANIVLTGITALTQVLDPTTDRNLDLPLVALAKGRGILKIVNTANADETITIRLASAGATQKLLRRGEWVELVSNGTVWLIVGEGYSGAPPVVVSSLGADVVLTDSDISIQRMDPTTARNVDLPVASGLNRTFDIINTANGAEIITIRLTSGGATVATPTQNESARVFSDGTNWFGFVYTQE